MSFGFRDEIGGISFPSMDGHVRIPRNTTDAVDSMGNLYNKDSNGRIIIPRCNGGVDDSSSVVTAANGLTGRVKWIGGSKIKVSVVSGNRIKISFDSSAEDESPSDDQESSCAHPGDEDPGNGGGVNPDDDYVEHEGGGGGGGGDSGGGVPGGGDAHLGDDGCCGNKQ